MIKKGFIVVWSCVVLVPIAIGMLSCGTGRNLSTDYYFEHQGIIDSIRNRFQACYTQKPFSIEFKDRNFRHISYEILNDTMRHIYNFDLENGDLRDTLDKYHYNTPEIIALLADMRSIRCTWISKLDYYENRRKKTLVFISVRHNKLESVFNGEKYYALAFFNERQTFDERGRLRDKSERRRSREINGVVFRRITDRICYAITGNFR